MDFLRLYSYPQRTGGTLRMGDDVSRWQVDVFELNDAAVIGQKGLYRIM
jgi:hypothetical protein